jgi:hypothetical protein
VQGDRSAPASEPAADVVVEQVGDVLTYTVAEAARLARGVGVVVLPRPQRRQAARPEGPWSVARLTQAASPLSGGRGAGLGGWLECGMTPGPRFLPVAIARRTRHRLPAPATSSWPSASARLLVLGRWCGPLGRPPAWPSGTPGWSCPRPTSPTSCGTCRSTGATPPWPGPLRCAGRCPARPACTPASPAWSAASRAGPPRCCDTCQGVPSVTGPGTCGRPSMPARSGPAVGSCGC